MHKEVEDYVDDMIVKSKRQEGHVPTNEKFMEAIHAGYS